MNPTLSTFIGKVTGAAIPANAQNWSYVYAFEPADPVLVQGRGNLYLVFDLPSEYESLGRKIIELIQETYYSEPAIDLLQRLEDSLAKANEAIDEFNRRLISTRQESMRKIHVTCAVLAGQDLHLTQIGKMDIYLIRKGRLNRINNTGADEPQADQAFRNIASGRMEVGDILTLTTPNTFEVIPMSQFKEIVTSCYPSVAASRLGEQLSKQKQSLERVPSILIVEMNADSERSAQPAASAPLSQPNADDDLDNQLKQRKDQIAAQLNEAPEDPLLDDPLAMPAMDPLADPYLDEFDPLSDDPYESPRARRQSSNSGGLGDRLSSATERLLSGLTTVSEFLVGLFTGSADRKRLRKIFLLLGVLLIGIVFYNVARNRQQENPQVQSTQAYEDAATNYNQALEALRLNNLNTARDYLEAAQTQAELALQIGINQEQVETLMADIQEELDRLDGVTRLDNLNLLADLREVNPSATPSALTRLGDDFYILDESNQTLFAVDGASGAASQPLDAILPGQSATSLAATDDQLYLFVPASNADDRNLLSYDPVNDQLSPVDKTFTDNWKATEALTSWEDATGSYRLYAVDDVDGALWRYRFSGDRLSEPADVINASTDRPDFASVVDVAIDGNVYLLTSGGQILKYAPSDLDTGFRLSGLEEPLEQPIALTTATRTESSPSGVGEKLYVADRGNQRVLVFSKSDGRLLNLYAADGAFTDLKDLVIDEDNNLLYVLDGAKLFKIQL